MHCSDSLGVHAHGGGVCTVAVRLLCMVLHCLGAAMQASLLYSMYGDILPTRSHSRENTSKHMESNVAFHYIIFVRFILKLCFPLYKNGGIQQYSGTPCTSMEALFCHCTKQSHVHEPLV